MPGLCGTGNAMGGRKRTPVGNGQSLALHVVFRRSIKLALQEKTGKVKDIKETVSSAVEIIHQIKTPGVLESFGKIMETGVIAKEIIEALKTPEMVKNIENIRVIAENINDVTTKMQNTLKQLEDTGIINETKGLVQSAKTTVDSFSSSQDLHEMGVTIKDLFKSVKVLVDGLKS